MKKALLISLVTLSMTAVAVRPAEAFWPFDSRTEENQNADGSLAARWQKMRREMNEWRSQWREARNEALAKFLGLGQEELAQKLQAGETPREIAEEQGLDIARWRETRQEVRREHWEEAGFTDEEIEARQERIQERQESGECTGQEMGGRLQGRLGRGQI